MNIKAFLFDMDGVIVDTEPQYDVLWKRLQAEYLPEVKDLYLKLRGLTLEDTIKIYFSHFSEEQQHKLLSEVYDFEFTKMEYDEIPGAVNFIKKTKEKGIKIALVTSSAKEKVAIVLEKLGLTEVFDAIVTSEDVTEGKPNPQCYLTGAEKLGMRNEECLVFEDSFAGIEAGTKAGMKVIGVASTNSEESLKNKVSRTILNFKNITTENLLE